MKAVYVRLSVKQAAESLRQMKVESIMLTSANEEAALYVGAQAGIKRAIAQALPHQKA